MYCVGIDIGGTKIKTGILDENGKIVIKSSIDTILEFGYKKTVNDIVNQINDLLKQVNISIDDIIGIGVGCPGAINSIKGTVDYSNNLEWVDVPLADELKKYFNKPVKVCNDANCAALGETMFGAGKQFSSTVLITIGTGIGGGVVIDNKLFEGNQSKGAELGHTVICKGGELCTCGRRGCLEAYASATALIRDTKVAMRKDKESMMWNYCNGDINNVSGKTSFECAKAGDECAKEVVDEYIEYLAEGICNFINVFRPEAIILGGGVCAQGEYLTKPLNRFIKTYSYGGDKSPSVELLIAKLGNDAGIVGAGSLILSDRK